MANWIKCQYHGTEQQHENNGMVNRAVNLDHVATFYKSTHSEIQFIIPTKENAVWEFINDETRDLEYTRISGLI